jgi:phospholipase D1/2
MERKMANKLDNSNVGGEVRPADLQSAVDEPGNPESWKKIQNQPKMNSAPYDGTFPFIPRNSDPSNGRNNASILPTWDRESLNLGSPMPFQNDFWKVPMTPYFTNNLNQIRGFITEIPLDWTKNENIMIKYPTPILVQNDGNQKSGSEHLEVFMAENSDMGKSSEAGKT